MMRVTKAVIPVAGLGTRMLPATKAIPKEMLPLVDKPLIQYVVNECVQAGIKEIVLVTHASKNSIENHFDTSFELEATLEKRVKRQLLEDVQSICPRGVTIMHVRQGVANGLGHAVLAAKPLIGNNPFAVVLPDVIIDEYHSSLKDDNLAAMISRYNKSQVGEILVEAVDPSMVSSYGIVDVLGVELGEGGHAPIARMIEKPSIEDSPSNLAIVGRYVLPPTVWAYLERTQFDHTGEIQLTDALESLLKEDGLVASSMKGKSHDCGSKAGYVKAFIEYALRHDVIGEEIFKFIKSK